MSEPAQRKENNIMSQLKNTQSSKALLLFFTITLSWTWIFGFIPVIFGFTGTAAGTFLFYFGGGAPSVTALFLVFLTYSKEARKDYFHRCFSFRRMGWKWPLLTFCIFSALTALSLFIGVVFLGYEMPAMDFLHAILKNPLMLFPILLISLASGPLNEEFGWRGFALDKLLVRFGFFGAALILGFIWGIWHLAWYFTPGQAQYQLLQKSIFDAFLFIPSSILLNFFVTFVYIKTRRSVLAGAMVHMFSNLLGSQLIAPYSTEISTLIRLLNMLFFTCILIYTCVSRKFKNETAEQIAAIQKGE